MNITIEQNKVVVILTDEEFPIFEAMFNNLDAHKMVSAEFRDFGGNSWNSHHDLLPMHLCRTIGEANLSEDPFATVSLYPFWKYGFAFGAGDELTLDPSQEDPHKKAVVADEMGMGFTAWAMEEIFDCEYWADASTLIKIGAVFPTGTKRPDFVCGFKDGSLGIFEAKGTTGSTGNLAGALADGKKQAASLTALDPISQRVVVGVAMNGGTKPTKVIMLDPPEPDADAIKTNITADLVKRAARKMRRAIPLNETEFRGPRREIKLTRDQYRADKRHGWIDILK